MNIYVINKKYKINKKKKKKINIISLIRT